MIETLSFKSCYHGTNTLERLCWIYSNEYVTVDDNYKLPASFPII